MFTNFHMGVGGGLMPDESNFICGRTLGMFDIINKSV